MVLVDSSVWIEFFRNGKVPTLEKLIVEDIICTNELILTELIPYLSHLGHQDTIQSLKAIQVIPLSIDWEIIQKYQLINLSNGINKVGIPDLLIIQQVIDQKLALYSLDKHFKLMKNHLNFDLLLHDS